MSRPTAPWAALMLAIATQAACATCQWQPLDPGRGHFTTGPFSIDLGTADQAGSPTAWQGPITISQAGGTSCSVDPSVGIIERPLFATARKMLVSSYSGSNKTVFIIDSARCKIAWKSRPFDGTIRLSGDRLSLGAMTLLLKPSCLP